MGMSPPIFSARWTICYHMMILGPVHASNLYHTSWNKIYVINEIENHEQYIHQVHHVPKCAHHEQHPCTSTMYINNVPKDIIHEMYRPYANMCIYQYANMCIYQLFQSCASTNMSTMCIYRYLFLLYHCVISPWKPTTVSEPTINNVRPCNIKLYHHIKLQAICIAFFPRLYNIYTAWCTTECVCMWPIQGQHAYAHNYHHCHPPMPQ